MGTEANRSYSIDNGSGILITFVILLYHLPGFCNLGETWFFLFIRSIFDFFMAWFFFKSGMFYKQRSVKEEFYKCWHRLILPFIIINLFCFILHSIINGGESLLEHLKVSIYRESEAMCSPLWFCLSLSIVRVLYQLIYNLLKLKKRWMILSISILFAFLMYVYSFKIDNTRFVFANTIPLWIGNVFLGLFFYSLGDLMRDKQYNKFLFIVATVIYLIHFTAPYYLDFFINYSDSYLLSVLFYISGIIVFNNALKRWLNKSITPLTHIGKHSMIYYITHWTPIYLIFVIYDIKATGWPQYIVAFILTFLYLISMDFLFRKTKLRVLIGG